MNLGYIETVAQASFFPYSRQVTSGHGANCRPFASVFWSQMRKFAKKMWLDSDFDEPTKSSRQTYKQQHFYVFIGLNTTSVSKENYK